MKNGFLQGVGKRDRFKHRIIIISTAIHSMYLQSCLKEKMLLRRPTALEGA